jgi:hypothetical protein
MKPLVREEGEWRSRSRKAAIPEVRIIEMRSELLGLDDSRLLTIARQSLTVNDWQGLGIAHLPPAFVVATIRGRLNQKLRREMR